MLFQPDLTHDEATARHCARCLTTYRNPVPSEYERWRKLLLDLGKLSITPLLIEASIQCQRSDWAQDKFYAIMRELMSAHNWELEQLSRYYLFLVTEKKHAP